ncbi:MAG: hypothetical protein GEV09_12640 [Pseudonocardiaceae bacterium]|nr:hypothetical protein [Pseudonocardiaceae bacterium]
MTDYDHLHIVSRRELGRDAGYRVDENTGVVHDLGSGTPMYRLRDEDRQAQARRGPDAVPADASPNRQRPATSSNGQTSDEPDEPDSWAPIDLGPYLRGEITSPEPTTGMARSDRLKLLYPGREHVVIGEMESGKSWYALGCAAAELVNGNHVIYVHFEEAEPADSVERLQALGVADDVILARFHFIGPNSQITAPRMRQLRALAPSLVILDGVNEAMSLHRWEINGTDAAALFRRYLVKPFTADGAAVLAADHVGKDVDRRGRYAIGSVHKGNGLTGAQLILENAAPFGRGRRGRSHVFVAKDRPGHLRRHGTPTRTPGKSYMGELVVDDTRTAVSYLDLQLWAPTVDAAETDSPEHDRHTATDAHVLNVVGELIAAGHSPTGRKIRAKSKYGTDTTLDALERLVLDRKLTKSDGPGKAHHYDPA